MTTKPAPSLDGRTLLAMFTAAAAWLERHIEPINAINVFPVPDGDTGTNMHLTMRAAIEAASRRPADHAGEVARAMADGALRGARGNSGVILSQIIRGLADGLSGKGRVDGRDLARALEQAAWAAYRSVSEPVEGTILTVARAAAAAAQTAAAEDEGAVAALAGSVRAAKEAVADTPRLLPVLAEAGVVDAGGEGLHIVLEGALRYLRGEDVEAAPVHELGAIRAGWRPAVEATHGRAKEFGYCTEFMLISAAADADRLRAGLAELGDSIIVVHDGELTRAHVHTDDPGRALSLATAWGRLRDVKVDDMEAQHETALRARQPAAAPTPPAISVVAVAAGEGMSNVLRGVGAAVVVSGGQTMNPSAQELLDGLRAAGSRATIILPNNVNVAMAARQAAELAGAPVRVVPTRSVPQGVAALLAFDAERSLDANATAMRDAAEAVRCAEITRAVRDVSIRNVTVRAGQPIVIIDHVLSAAADSFEEAAMRALQLMAADEAALATIYFGAAADERSAQGLAERVRGAYPHLEVEVVRGDQPHYPYIVSLE